MIVEKQMECRLAEETEVLGENLPQRHFRPSQNPTWPDPGLNPTRRGGKPATNRLSYGAASSRYLDKRLIDVCKVVSPTRRPHFTPGFFIFKDSWCSFLLEAESNPGPVRPEGLGQFKKIHLIGTWTPDLSACSMVP
jgi:hypothetical protein